MNLIPGPGLVLRRNKHLETDVHLHLFMKETGKVYATVKGGQRFSSKLKSLQEPFTLAEFQVYRQIQESHQFLRTDYKSFLVASKCCEVIDALLPFRAPSPDVFDILHHTLQGFQSIPEPERVWIRFVVELLENLGHGDMSKDLNQRSLGYSLAYVESRLESILPWKLKSEVLSIK